MTLSPSAPPAWAIARPGLRRSLLLPPQVEVAGPIVAVLRALLSGEHPRLWGSRLDYRAVLEALSPAVNGLAWRARRDPKAALDFLPLLPLADVRPKMQPRCIVQRGYDGATATMTTTADGTPSANLPPGYEGDAHRLALAAEGPGRRFCRRWLLGETPLGVVMALATVDALGMDPLAWDNNLAQSPTWREIYGKQTTFLGRQQRRGVRHALRREGWRELDDALLLEAAAIWVQVNHVHKGLTAGVKAMGGLGSPDYTDLHRVSLRLQRIDRALGRERRPGRPRPR